MGKRGRRRERTGSGAGGPSSSGGPASFADLGLDLDLPADPDVTAQVTTEQVPLAGDLGVLTVRTVMSPGTRTEYAAVRRGDRSSPAAMREDAWHRQVEFLFERLVVKWDVAGVPTVGQASLLKRLRVATGPERTAVRQALRAHLAAHFPDLEAP